MLFVFSWTEYFQTMAIDQFAPCFLLTARSHETGGDTDSDWSRVITWHCRHRGGDTGEQWWPSQCVTLVIINIADISRERGGIRQEECCTRLLVTWSRAIIGQKHFNDQHNIYANTLRSVPCLIIDDDSTNHTLIFYYIREWMSILLSAIQLKS